jgi:hypothetical protein
MFVAERCIGGKGDLALLLLALEGSLDRLGCVARLVELDKLSSSSVLFYFSDGVWKRRDMCRCR